MKNIKKIKKSTWIILAIVIVWTFLIGWFFSNFYLQSPVKTWQCFLCSRYTKTVIQKPNNKVLTPVLTPKPKTEREVIMSMKHGPILWKIYGAESTWGKFDYCRNNGRGYGGFGMMDNGQVICYLDFNTAVNSAERLLTGFGVDSDLASALCLWNTGSRMSDCPYYRKYLTL